MQFFNNLSYWTQGYFWATILFPVEYYLLKPVALRLYNDAIYYVNPILTKVTGKVLPNAA